MFTFSVDPSAGIFQPADADLTALASNSTNGLWARTGAGTGAARTLTGTANEITISNGDGVSGAPTFSLPAALTFTGKTITGGTYSFLTISGAVTITAPATVSASWMFDGPRTSRLVDAGAGAGPLFSTFRDSATPAANDLIGFYSFFGRDSAANIEEYARIQGSIVDPASASEDGQLSLQTVVAGTLAGRFNVAQGAWIGSATGTDKGVGTLNLAGDLYNNNTAPTGTGGYVRSIAPSITGGMGVAGGLAVTTGGVSIAGGANIDTINLTGGQIAFPASANASANANTLDDYEEGTWTPSITFATPGDLSIAYIVRLGVYTKIGRLVALNWVTLTSTFTHATAGGACSITGLPFTSANVANQHAYGATNFSGVMKASYFGVTHAVLANTAAVSFFTVGIGSAAALLNAADMPTGGTVQLSGGVQFVV